MNEGASLMLQVRYGAGQECRKTLSSKAKVNLPDVAGTKVYSQQ